MENTNENVTEIKMNPEKEMTDNSSNIDESPQIKNNNNQEKVNSIPVSSNTKNIQAQKDEQEQKAKNLSQKRREKCIFQDFKVFPTTNDIKSHKTKEKAFKFYKTQYEKEVKANQKKEGEIESAIADFLQSIFSIQDKKLSSTFNTLEFISSDLSLMKLFLSHLNSKRSEKMFLPETQFQNLATVFISFLDTLLKKMNFSLPFVPFPFSNFKDQLLEIIEFLIILGQTFYLKSDSSETSSKELISNRMKHKLWDNPGLWEDIIEFHIKKEIKNQKRLGQVINADKKISIATSTLITYFYNYQNFSQNKECKEAILQKAKEYKVPSNIFDNV